MEKHLATLSEDRSQRTTEEYLGAFTESMKIIQHQNPVERIGHAVLLTAKTALRLRAANPNLPEHEIARWLQTIARNLRITAILDDLTPEEKRFLHTSARRPAAAPIRSRRRAGQHGRPRTAKGR